MTTTTPPAPDLDEVLASVALHAHNARQATIDRDAAIRTAIRLGASQRTIAGAAGLSPGGVRRILARPPA